MYEGDKIKLEQAVDAETTYNEGDVATKTQ